MRENMGLYHGKRVDNGEWVEGSLSTEYLKECGCVMISPTADTCYKVDPETVGQFIGLADKNSRKIFEGDIVKRFWLGMEIIYKITYESKHACFIGEAINTSGFTTFDNDGKKYEIIGNIHDNPELLKGGAE